MNTSERLFSNPDNSLSTTKMLLAKAHSQQLFLCTLSVEVLGSSEPQKNPWNVADCALMTQTSNYPYICNWNALQTMGQSINHFLQLLYMQTSAALTFFSSIVACCFCRWLTARKKKEERCCWLPRERLEAQICWGPTCSLPCRSPKWWQHLWMIA